MNGFCRETLELNNIEGFIPVLELLFFIPEPSPTFVTEKMLVTMIWPCCFLGVSHGCANDAKRSESNGR